MQKPATAVPSRVVGSRGLLSSSGLPFRAAGCCYNSNNRRRRRGMSSLRRKRSAGRRAVKTVCPIADVERCGGFRSVGVCCCHEIWSIHPARMASRPSRNRDRATVAGDAVGGQDHRSCRLRIGMGLRPLPHRPGSHPGSHVRSVDADGGARRGVYTLPDHGGCLPGHPLEQPGAHCGHAAARRCAGSILDRFLP